MNARTGFVLTAVLLTVRREDTGITRRTATDQAGYYHPANLEPGMYEIEVVRSGFMRALRQVTLRVGNSLTVDFELQVSGPDERVDVRGTASGVNMSRYGVAGIRTRKRCKSTWIQAFMARSPRLALDRR